MIKDLNTMSYTIENNVGYIVLDGEHNNRMNKEFFKELKQVVDQCSMDNIKGLIITGKKRHYSVGVNVDELKEQIKTETIVNEEGKIIELPMTHLTDKKTFIKLSKLTIPVISVIRGFCIGSGFELALNSHIRICERGAQVGSPEAEFGFMPALGGCVQAINIGGFSNAIEAVMKAKIYTAEEIEKLTLVDMVVEKKTGLQIAQELLDYIYSSERVYKPEEASDIVVEFKMKKQSVL